MCPSTTPPDGKSAPSNCASSSTVGRSESLQACARRVWQEVPEVGTEQKALVSLPLEVLRPPFFISWFMNQHVLNRKDLSSSKRKDLPCLFNGWLKSTSRDWPELFTPWNLFTASWVYPWKVAGIQKVFPSIYFQEQAVKALEVYTHRRWWAEVVFFCVWDRKLCPESKKETKQIRNGKKYDWTFWCFCWLTPQLRGFLW